MSGTIPNQFKSTRKMDQEDEAEEEEEEEEEPEDDPDHKFVAKRRKTPGILGGGRGDGDPAAGEEEEEVEEEEDDQNDEEDSSSISVLSSARRTRSKNAKSGGSAPPGGANGNSTCVKVALRIRPLLPREVIANSRECISVTPNEPQVWISQTHAFTYDHVFKTDSGQDEIFGTVAKPLVDGILEGYNATILAYGQTGSGKTYTMGTGFDPNIVLASTTTSSGSSSSHATQGLLPRCITYLFDSIHKQRVDNNPPPDFQVCVQFTELYNEEVIDLLSDNPRPTTAYRPGSAGTGHQVKIHEQSNGQIYLVNINTRGVGSAQETLETLKTGALNRTTASTNMNDSSSRSHAIFTIMITQNRVIRDKSGQTDIETLSGKFHFVDLAGSERLKRTLATGDRAREGIAINSGLLALGNVISALGDKSKKSTHVPYRDSKLTRLLQDSLGGNSRTLMIACVSPNELDFVETLNTMKYANRAKNIKNRVVVNQDQSSRTIGLLKDEIARLKEELSDYKRGVKRAPDGEEIGDVNAENMMLLTEVEALKARIKSKQETIDNLTSQVARLQAHAVIADETSKISAAGGAGGLRSGSGTGGATIDCDLTALVTKYLHEIQDLRSKLYEAESECEKLKSKQRVMLNKLASPRDSGGGGANNSGVFVTELAGGSGDLSELLSKAKKEIKLEKTKKAVATRRAPKQRNGDNEDDEEPQGEEEEEEQQQQQHDVEDEDDVEDDDEDDDEDEDDEEEQDDIEAANLSYTELAQLTQDISTKQRLIEELENSQLRLESLKQKYEEKLAQLTTKIRCTEEERDAVLGKSTSANNKSLEYENKIVALQRELKKWANAKREHQKLLKNQTQYESQIRKLRGDVEEMKRAKVKLMNQVRNEGLRHREVDKLRVKEITQLKKESRKQDVRVRKLESETKMKDAVLRRKIEEVEMLKNKGIAGNKRVNPRVAGSSGVMSGSGIGSTTIYRSRLPKNTSPVKGKQVWSRVQLNLMKDVNSRFSVANLEREMVQLIARRSYLNGELEGETDPDRIDTIESNLKMVESSINKVREEIVCADVMESSSGNNNNSSSRATGGGRSNNPGAGFGLTSRPGSAATTSGGGSGGLGGGALCLNECVTPADYQYVVDKLYEQSIVSMTDVGLLEGKVKEAEEANRHLNVEVATLRELLHHMYTRKNADELESTSSSLDSLRMMPPPQFPPPPTLSGNQGTYHSSSTQHPNQASSMPPPPSSHQNPGSSSMAVKARRRLTSTTQELLGSAESVEALVVLPSNNQYDLPGAPNNRSTFTRGTRLTQSMRAPSSGNLGITNNKPIPIKKKPALVRQDTYSVLPDMDPNTTYVVIDDPNNALVDESNNYTNKAPLQRSVSEIVESSVSGGSGGGTSERTNSAGPSTYNASSLRRGIHGNGNLRHSPRGNAWLQQQRSLEGHTKPILCLSSTESTLVSGSKDGSCRVWDLETGSETACFDGHPHNVTCVCHVPDLNLVLTGSSYQVRVYDLRCKDVVKVLSSSGPQLPATAATQQSVPPIPSLPQSTPLPRVNELPAGEKTVFSIQRVRNHFFTGFGERIKIWDLRKQSSIGTLAGKHMSTVMCMTGAESGLRSNDWVITGSKDHSIKVYEYEPNTPPDQINTIRTLSPPHYDGIECLVMNRSGSSLYSGSRDTCIKKWDLQSFKMVSTVTNAHSGWITGLCHIPGVNDPQIVESYSNDMATSLSSCCTSSSTRQQNNPKSSSSPEYVVSCSRDGILKVWDAGNDFREISRFETNFGMECVHSNNRLLFFGGGGPTGNAVSNNNPDVSMFCIGAYKVSDSFARSLSSPGGPSSSFVNTNSRGGSGERGQGGQAPSGSISTYKLQTQYLHSNE